MTFQEHRQDFPGTYRMGMGQNLLPYDWYDLGNKHPEILKVFEGT